MSRQIPSFTLPLCAFSGFAPDTQALLSALFADPPVADGATFRAFEMKHQDFANSSAPYQMNLLLEAEDGALRSVHVNDAPASLRHAVAAAGFLLANDSGCNSLAASARLNSGSVRHAQTFITDLGSVSSGFKRTACKKGAAGTYQTMLDSGDAFLAYVPTGQMRSAHTLLNDRRRLLPLAEDLYAAAIQALPKSSRTGICRRINFVSSTDIRSPHLATT